MRGIWMLADSPLMHRKWVRVLPHVVDTLLLASAVGLTVMLQQYPLAHGWLTAKVIGLLAYIVLGMVALRHGRAKGLRATAWVAALVTFFYIVSVALTHDARGFLTWV